MLWQQERAGRSAVNAARDMQLWQGDMVSHGFGSGGSLAKKIDAGSGKRRIVVCAGWLLVRVAMFDDKADSTRGGIRIVEEARKGSKKAVSVGR